MRAERRRRFRLLLFGHLFVAPTARAARGTIVRCSDGARYQYDCGSIGLDCALEEDGGQTCTFTAWPRLQRRRSEHLRRELQRGELTFCYGGAPVTVDCQDYSFDSSKEVVDGLTYALCENL